MRNRRAGKYVLPLFELENEAGKTLETPLNAVQLSLTPLQTKTST